MGGGRWKLFAKLLHLCSLRRSWRRQLMDMEHPFAFASQVSSGAFKVFPAYLQLASISPVQCKISSRNELNCNTFWCPIRSYLCIIKSNTCSDALMSPLQLNYRAERINAKVLNGQNNVHVNGQTKVHAYHIPPLSLLPPASPCCVTCTKCILDLLTTTHFDYIRCQAATGWARGAEWERGGRPV